MEAQITREHPDTSAIGYWLSAIRERASGEFALFAVDGVVEDF
jgi:hypothetical protein